MRKRKRGDLPRMIVDRAMCIRVADGDEQAAKPTTPYHCPICCADPTTFSGRLRYEGEPPPTCDEPAHEETVWMVP